MIKTGKITNVERNGQEITEITVEVEVNRSTYSVTIGPKTPGFKKLNPTPETAGSSALQGDQVELSFKIWKGDFDNIVITKLVRTI